MVFIPLLKVIKIIKEKIFQPEHNDKPSLSEAKLCSTVVYLYLLDLEEAKVPVVFTGCEIADH